MSYIILNKRQKTGKIIERVDFQIENEKYFIELIEIDKPYKNGIKYSVNENTKNAFCSCGLFASKDFAYDKFNLMRRNCNLFSNDEFKKLQKSNYYYKKG